jgi:hypothetical protein
MIGGTRQLTNRADLTRWLESTLCVENSPEDGLEQARLRKVPVAPQPAGSRNVHGKNAEFVYRSQDIPACVEAATAIAELKRQASRIRAWDFFSQWARQGSRGDSPIITVTALLDCLYLALSCCAVVRLEGVGRVRTVRRVGQ